MFAGGKHRVLPCPLSSLTLRLKNPPTRLPQTYKRSQLKEFQAQEQVGKKS